MERVELNEDRMFPQNFKYIITEKSLETNYYVLRVAMKGPEDVEPWIREFEKRSLTRWIVHRALSSPKRIAFHKYWLCHLSKKNQSNCPKFSKKVGCRASLDVKLKLLNTTSRRDKFLRGDTPLNAIIKINLNHNHQDDSASYLFLLRPSQATVQDFDEYFDNGLTPVQAIQLHESKILSTEDAFLKLANATLNPPKRWVYFRYNKWKEHRQRKQRETNKAKQTTLLNRGESFQIEESEDLCNEKSLTN